MLSLHEQNCFNVYKYTPHKSVTFIEETVPKERNAKMLCALFLSPGPQGKHVLYGQVVN